MKSKLSIFLYGIMLILFSCAKDETKVVLGSDAKPAVIVTAATDLQPVIKQETLTKNITISWKKANYGVHTQVNYTLQLDSKCNSFASPVILGSTSDSTFTTTLDNLNAKLLNDLKLTAHEVANLQLRIVSVINNMYPQNSEVVSFSITPWSDAPTGLWLLSDTWSIDKAPFIYTVNKPLLEGYVSLGKDTAFRFANTRVCPDTIYGSSGTAGQLTQDGSATGVSAPESGYYKVNVDTKNLTYQLTLIKTWGMIGSATPGGWNTSTPLTYDKTKRVWKGNVDLTGGALKFRANDGWDLNYGPANSNSLDGQLIFNDPGAISIGASGNYDVTVDFSQSKAPYAYTYSVVKNNSIKVPTHLWVSGGYEGFDPSKAPVLNSLTSAGTTFEGYVNISSSTGIKFTSDPDYNHTNYGYGGTAGTLSTSGPDIDMPVAGYYKINVDIKNLTYTAVPISSMGLIGTSTPGAWTNSTPMDYNAATGLWSKTVDLVAGALKFRANDAWTINYGPADANSYDGSLIFDDQGSIDIKAAGNYTVTLDLSRSKVPYQYSYTIVKN